MNIEATLAAIYQSHRIELERLRRNHARELNAKLEQINKQAETIRDERQRAIEWATAAGKEAAINIELKTQLLSALAAIEKNNNKTIKDGFGTIMQSIDLSLLHEHDAKERAKTVTDLVSSGANKYIGERIAEVRKPLVDALEKIAAYKLSPNRERSVQTTIDCRQIAADALAKMKEL